MVSPVDFSTLEIAPGVFFKKGERGNYRIWIQADDREIMGWDYEEIKTNPQAWFDSLKTVALSVQNGPSVARKFAEETRKNIKPPYGSITCNICGEKFVAAANHPFVFVARLNGKTFHDFQCSEFCHKQRRAAVYEQEIGEGFMKLWNTRFAK